MQQNYIESLHIIKLLKIQFGHEYFFLVYFHFIRQKVVLARPYTPPRGGPWIFALNFIVIHPVCPSSVYFNWAKTTLFKTMTQALLNLSSDWTRSYSKEHSGVRSFFRNSNDTEKSVQSNQIWCNGNHCFGGFRESAPPDWLKGHVAYRSHNCPVCPFSDLTDLMEAESLPW